MESYRARFDSFKSDSSSKTAKRTKQTLAKSTSSHTLRWPHPSNFKATPRTLAEAGFFFDPSLDDRDNVTCFMCGKELSDWDPEDNPFQIHWEKCRNICAWAIARCGLITDLEKDGTYRFKEPSRQPTSKVMEKARLDTFSWKGSWPHDSPRHGANAKKMAKAGFVYTPQTPGDDTATCVYCKVSLSGWESEDDPREEHLTRSQKFDVPCVFFQEQSAKPTKLPPRTASRAKMQPISSDDELASVPTSNSRATRQTDNKVPAGPAKTPGSRRSTKTPASKPAADSEADDFDGASGSDAGKRVSKSKRSRTVRGKGKIHVIEEEEEGAKDGGQGGTEAEAPAPKEKPKRGRPPKNKKPGIEKESEQEDDEPVPPSKKAPGRTRSRATLESQSDILMESSSKSGHSRTKSTSKSTHIMPSVIVDISSAKATSSKKRSEEERSVKSPRDKASASKAPRAAKAKQNVSAARPVSISSTSDDAGYATAEPPKNADDMDVDDIKQSRPNRQSDSRPSSSRANGQYTQTNGDVEIVDSGLLPIPDLSTLTEEEGVLTIEQYIRREMEKEYQRLREDVERRISDIRAHAAKARARVEAL